jgi:FkbM family methyltransferase
VLRAFVKRYALGRARFQPAFALLHRVSLAGMNFGPALPETTGELQLLDLVAARPSFGSAIVFDVGANAGDYSAAVLARLPSARLYAFEPSETAFRELEKRVGTAAKLFNVALSDRNASGVLYSDHAGSGIASLFDRDLGHASVAMSRREAVALRALDEVCDEEKVERIDLLKLDVEGSELDVLRGAERLLSRGAIEVIQFEFGGCNIDSRTFLRDFFSLLGGRYRIYRIVRDGLVPVDSYSEALEIFVTVNYAAIRRTP